MDRRQATVTVLLRQHCTVPTFNKVELVQTQLAPGCLAVELWSACKATKDDIIEQQDLQAKA